MSLGKAGDDRVGFAVVIEAMRRLASLPRANQVLWTVTTQEEIGLRGAHSAFELIKPDIGIAVEAGVTADANRRPEEPRERLGAGPGLFLYNNSDLPNRKFVRFVRDTASAQKLPLQFDLVAGCGDDSAESQKSKGASPRSVCSCPCVTPMLTTAS